MKNKYQRLKLLTLLVIASLMLSFTNVHAHPGHDHTHWFSGIIHMMFFGGIILFITTLMVICALKTKLAKEKSSKK